MRRLLLLLLTLLIPLQLLAATGEVQLRERLREQLPVASQPASHAHAHGQACLAADARSPDALVDLSDQGSLSGDEQSSGSDDDDQPTAQGELEDPALPVAIATPGLHWLPFPHAFSASLNWSSFLRDQLRPPPLA